MFRTMMSFLVMLGVFVAVSTAADKDIPDKNAKEGKITKVDAKKHTMTVKTKTDDKDVEKTFKLAEEIEYMDSTGKVAKIDIFTLGDQVLFLETEGTITKMKKCDKSAPKPKTDE